MRRYPILTPFKHNGEVHKSGTIDLDEIVARPYFDAGVIGRAIEEGAADPLAANPQQDSSEEADSPDDAVVGQEGDGAPETARDTGSPAADMAAQAAVAERAESPDPAPVAPTPKRKR